MPSKIIFSASLFLIIYISSFGTAFSQEQKARPGNQAEAVQGKTDPDTALFQKYVDSIHNFSVSTRIQILKRFIELHPENRHVPEVKDMIAEYYRLVDPRSLQEMEQPQVIPPAPADQSPTPAGVPAAENPEALIPPQTAAPDAGAAALPVIEPEKNIKNNAPDCTEAFNEGFENGKNENSRFRSGMGAGIAAGIAGTLVTEIILILLIAASVS